MKTQLVIVLSGKKRSGKNTSANFVAGLYLEMTGRVRNFSITSDGELRLQTNDGETVIVKEGKFNDWLGWDSIRMYSFADELKRFCIRVLGLSVNSCFGTEDEKNSPTHLLWQNMPINEKGQRGHMTGREVMQYFGTEVVRAIYPDAWVFATFNKIEEEHPKIAIVTDGRCPNETDYANNYGAKTVRMLRNVAGSDQHFSEVALDDYPLENYSLVIPNQDMTITQQNQFFLPHVLQWFYESDVIRGKTESC